MNWGFIGYGRIAKKFEESLRSGNLNVSAIASRSQFDNIPGDVSAYDNYEALVLDPNVDIVYVSSTHNYHADHSILAMENGKHVLCEKPLATSHKDVQRMIDSAQSNRVFLMEAIWSRYLPAYQKVMSIVHSGVIGTIQFVSAHFGFRMNPEAPKERLVRPELAAGAIWDVGIYPLSIILDLYSANPINMDVRAKLSDLKVEERCYVQMEFEENRFAQFSCAFDLLTPNKALISGTEGIIEMEDFWKCETFTVSNDEGTVRYSLPMSSNGLIHEALACEQLITEGKLESPLIPHTTSLTLAKLMDEIIKSARSN